MSHTVRRHKNKTEQTKTQKNKKKKKNKNNSDSPSKKGKNKKSSQTESPSGKGSGTNGKELWKELEGSLKHNEVDVMREAIDWLGTPYKYGRQDKNLATDCSGFVMQVFDISLGCKLPRNSAKQAEYCADVSSQSVKPCDLVFFITNGGDRINHVGIMIDNKRFIHASSSKGVVVSSLESGYYQTRLQKFGRVPCIKH